MPLETFKSSQSLTMGVELELQLVNTYDMDLSSSANDLLELLRRKPFPGVVTPEMTQSMIEIATDVQTAHGPLLAQLREIRDTLVTSRRPAQHRACRRWHPPVPALVRAAHLRQAALRAALGPVRLPGQAVHRVRPARAHRLQLARRGAVPAALAQPLRAALHRALGLVAVLPGRGHAVRFGAAELGVRLPAQRSRALHPQLGSSLPTCTSPRWRAPAW